MAGQPRVKQTRGAKGMQAPLQLEGPFPSKGTGQVGTGRKEWIQGIPLKIQLSGGVW